MVGKREEDGTEAPMDPKLARTWEQGIHALFKRRYEIIDSAPRYKWNVQELRLSFEAAGLRRKFHNEIERRQRPGGDLEGLGGIASKVAGETARLAGLLHLFELAMQGEIDKATQVEISPNLWGCAEAYQRWQLQETVAVIARGRESGDARKGRRLLEWVARKPKERRVLGSRNVLEARIVGDAKEGEKLLDWLAERGWMRRAEQKGRERTPRWDVHPVVLALKPDSRRPWFAESAATAEGGCTGERTPGSEPTNDSADSAHQTGQGPSPRNESAEFAERNGSPATEVDGAGAPLSADAANSADEGLTLGAEPSVEVPS
jgi:hypothetical protein